jgi:hypothetical protein
MKEIRELIKDIVKIYQEDKGYIEFDDDTSYPNFNDFNIGNDTIIAVRYNEYKNSLEFISESQMVIASDATDEDWFNPDTYGTFNNNELLTILRDIAMS